MVRSPGMSTSGTNEDPPGGEASAEGAELDSQVHVGPESICAELERQLGLDLKAAGEVAWDAAIRLTQRRDLAEELVQDTFVRLSRAGRAGTLDIQSNGTAYIRKTVVNLFRDNIRKRKRAAVVEVPMENFDWITGSQARARGPKPEEVVVALELNQAITQAINSLKLSAENRRIVTLLVNGGHSIAEIADTLNMAPSTVRSRIQSIQRDIRLILNRSGWGLH